MLHGIIARVVKIFKRGRRRGGEINPDDIFLDSSNLPQFDTSQFEGRLDRPISKYMVYAVALFFVLVVGVYTARSWTVQIARGESLRERSEKNNLRHTPLFAARGVIHDRTGEALAWNVPGDTDTVAMRTYKNIPGLAHTLGYVQYPTKDSNGFYYREDFVGVDGVEKLFNDELQGTNGSRIIEVNALGKVESESVVKPPQEGKSIYLSIDAGVQSALYGAIENVSKTYGFAGGAGVIMDTKTGEVLAMTSYPEFNSDIMSQASDKATIQGYLKDTSKPFLDRVIDGLYVPGSTVKPFIALAALHEDVISPNKIIQANGQIAVPNDYDPTKETIFRDWKVHGPVDMRRAIAVSSDVYFYAVGGGYKDQKGLGIRKIDEYVTKFGFAEVIEEPFFKGKKGVIPTPEWKKEVFNGESWRLGNTYHTSIGQYGFQVSPIQMVRAVAGIARDGSIINPSIVKDVQGNIIRNVDIPLADFKVIKEGMRQTVTEGTARGLDVPYVKMAAKTGTAELGVTKENVNSWVTGFWPLEQPRYAFAVVLERGSRSVLVGATAAFRQAVDWMHTNTPEYFESK